MNLLIFSQDSPEVSIGGIERHIQNLFDFTAKQKKHHFIFLLPSSHKKSYQKNKNISIYRKYFLKKNSIHQQQNRKAKDIFDFTCQLIDKEKVDAVIGQGSSWLPPAFNLSFHMACFYKKVPLYLRLHSFPPTRIRLALINSLPWKKLLPVSKSVSSFLINKDIDSKKIYTHYIGVNSDQFNPNQDKFWLKDQFNIPHNHKIILHASRIISGHNPVLKEKGVLDLVEAFARIVPHCPNCHLIIAAGGQGKDYQQAYNDTVAKLKGHISIHNLGNKVYIKSFRLNQMPKVYTGANLFVMASETETFGQTYLEAMACGTPVIGTNVGGIPEIITDNYNGFLVPPHDHVTLAQQIKQLINNQNLRQNFIKNGLKTTAEKFDAQILFKQLFNYIKSDIKNKT